MNESIIKDIGRSYIVSSLLPAACFVSLATIIFRGFTPKILIDRLNGDIYYLNSVAAIMVVLILWIAFALYSSVDVIFKLYEGYFFPKWLSRLLTGPKLGWHRNKLQTLYKYKWLKNQPDSPDRDFQLAEMRQQVYSELQSMEIVAPLDKESLMPTRLGNILRASEQYSLERYEMDGISIWPRLAQLFPEKFTKDLEEKNNQLYFFLCSSILSVGLGVSSLLISITRVAICQMSSAYCNPNSNLKDFFNRGFENLSAFEYFVVGSGLMVLGYILYRVGTNVAEEFGLFIRTGFDLYRFKLLVELNHPLPTSLEEERRLWRTISDFLVTGDRLGRSKFDYQLKKELLEGQGKITSTGNQSSKSYAPIFE